jgi:hypothetical protein
MIQLVFDADDAEEALAESPVSIGYSQHEGAERADWGADKLELVESTHPVVYPAVGSHANYFQSALHLGRSAQQGIGCDDTAAPHRELRPVVALVPSGEDTSLAEYPWLAYPGHWGEKRPGIFNGPTGPNEKAQWTRPITWSEEEWRESSTEIPETIHLGSGSTDFFCSGVGLRLARRRTWGQIVVAAGRLYAEHVRVFLVVTAFLAPIPILFTASSVLVNRVTTANALFDSLGTVALLGGVTLNVLALALALVPVTVAIAMAQMDDDQPVGLGPVVRETLARAWAAIKAWLMLLLVATVLLATIVGAPLGVWLLVRWSLALQVVALEEAGARDALRRSSRLVKGHWWKALSITALGTLLPTILGPLFGAALILATGVDFDLVNLLAALVFVFLMPFGAILKTYLYHDLCVREALPGARGGTPRRAPCGARGRSRPHVGITRRSPIVRLEAPT